MKTEQQRTQELNDLIAARIEAAPDASADDVAKAVMAIINTTDDTPIVVQALCYQWICGEAKKMIARREKAARHKAVAPQTTTASQMRAVKCDGPSKSMTPHRIQLRHARLAQACRRRRRRASYAMGQSVPWRERAVDRYRELLRERPDIAEQALGARACRA